MVNVNRVFKKLIEEENLWVFTVLCALIFGALILPFNFPPIADDFVFLFRVENESFPLSSFGRYWARVPLWCLGTWSFFEAKAIEWQKFLTLLLFTMNGSFLYLFAKRTHKALFPEEKASSYVFLGAMIYSFFPNDHEVLYWMTCWAYMGGVFFLYVAWTSRSIVGKSILYLCCFCFGDSQRLFEAWGNQKGLHSMA